MSDPSMSDQPYSTPAWAEPELLKRARSCAELTASDVLPDLTGRRSRRNLDQRDANARQKIWELLGTISELTHRVDELTRDNEAWKVTVESTRQQLARMGAVYNGHDAATLVATAIAVETGQRVVKSVVLDGVATCYFSNGAILQHTLAEYGPHRLVIDTEGGSLTFHGVSPTGELTTTQLAQITLLMAGPEPAPSDQAKSTGVDFDVVLMTCDDANCPWCSRLRDQSSSFGPKVSFMTVPGSILPHYDFGDFSSSAWPEGGPHFPFGHFGSDGCANC